MRRLLIVVAVAALLCAVGVAAQDAPEPGATAARAPGRLTDADLFAMLDGLGVEPVKVNEAVFRVTVRQDGWTVPVQFALSRSEEKVWMTAFLGGVSDPEQASASSLRALLTAYEAVAPAHFFLKDGGLKLHLGMALDNRAVTPAALRRDLDHLCAGIRATADLWNAPPWNGVGRARKTDAGGGPDEKEPGAPAGAPGPEGSSGADAGSGS